MDSADYFPELNKAVLARIAAGWKHEFKEIKSVSIHACCGERKSKYVVIVRLQEEARPEYDRDIFFDLVTRIEEVYKEAEIYSPPRKARKGDWGSPEIYFEDEILSKNIQPEPALLLLEQSEIPRKRSITQAPEPIEPITGEYVHIQCSDKPLSAISAKTEEIIIELNPIKGNEVASRLGREPDIIIYYALTGILKPIDPANLTKSDYEFYRSLPSESQKEYISKWLYSRCDVESIERQLIKSQKQKQDSVIPSEMRANQRHKAECRKVAAEIWEKNPDITIEDMALRDEITNIWQGQRKKDYAPKTIREWIKSLSPNRAPGRRKAK